MSDLRHYKWAEIAEGWDFNDDLSSALESIAGEADRLLDAGHKPRHVARMLELVAEKVAGIAQSIGD